MDAREQRGLELASKSNITFKNGQWFVPSQSGKDKYKVEIEETARRCSCPDFSFRHTTCKHIFAVQFVIQQKETKTEVKDGKAVVTETVVTKRVSYKQEWTSYNRAATGEKREFQVLLYELCAGVETPVKPTGRPRIPLSDVVFSAVFKVYSTVSGRRFMSDLKEAQLKGYVSEMPHYNSVSRYLESEALTPLLKHLITQSSLPLKDLESDFAVDSSGFATCHFSRWFNAKYGRELDYRQWLKVHLMCGTHTNIVTSVELSKAYVHDNQFFKPLVEKTAQSGFKMNKISADKAYLSAANLELSVQKGATPLIPFKSNSLPDRQGKIWAKLYHFYHYNFEEFEAHYHKRSNVESTFSMIKAKFGERLRSKTETAQINEALCKVLAHNICVVIQSIHQFGIEAGFGAEV